MHFLDTYVSTEQRFSIGTEVQSGRHYVSIPVSGGVVDYEEYYEISQAVFDAYCKEPGSALAFVQQCRQRQHDGLLIIQPGSNRGTAL